MRICFLCGSLEVGRDGVGDYVRRLAAEIIRQGHAVTIIAIHDRFATGVVRGEQPSDDTPVPVLRIPAASAQRIEVARQWIDAHGPEWLSLQFVIYSFSPRGLPLGLGRELSQLAADGGPRWHLMFHELWIGMDRKAPWRRVALGWLQRRVIRDLVGRLQPKVVHTQTTLYAAQLLRLGCPAEILPLFGNIPVTAAIPPRALDFTSAQTVRLVHFGSIHPGAPIEEFARDVGECFPAGANICLVLLGKCGPEGAKWAGAWRRAGLKVEAVGEQSSAGVSEILAGASIGLSSTPYALIEKSGSVAAMMDHQLPIICVAPEWEPRNPPPDRVDVGIGLYCPGALRRTLAELRPASARANPASVAERLLTTLFSS